MGDKRRIGVIGGSFDPVHFGHLGIAEEAREAFGLERVVFVPAAQPPHKGGRALAAGEDRVRMVEIAIADNPRFFASDIEMHREGPSYTIDTLTEIKADKAFAGATPFFIMGADSLNEMHLWHRACELVEGHDFIIVGRPGVAPPDRDALAERFGETGAEKLVAGYIDTAPYNVSATDVRRRVKAGKSIRYLVPRAVERYITARGLYA